MAQVVAGSNPVTHPILWHGKASLSENGGEVFLFKLLYQEYHLSKLKEKGVLKRIGQDKGGHWEVVVE